MYDDQVYFYEESHYFQTMFDLVDLYREYGDRVFDDLERHCPTVYEAFAAHMANKQIEEFLSNKSKDENCDTFGSKITNCSVNFSEKNEHDYYK